MTDCMRNVAVVAIMTLGAGTLQADVLHLADGTRLVGTIEQITDAGAKVSKTFAGELTVPRDKIVSLETQGPVTVQLSDGSYLTGRVEPVDGEQADIAVNVEALGSRPLALSGVRGVFREDPQNLQRRMLSVKVSGDANVGISLTSGNTESENLHLDTTVVTRTPRNRYTLSGEYNEEESDNILVKQNWAGLVKYDHFVSDKWFWFNSATFESDEFRDLDLRSALAAGIGYQFFESATRSLSLEIGPSYIDENFDVAEDESFVGSRWAITYDQHLWDGLSFFHFQEGLMGLESSDDLTIRSRTGFRMNVTERIIARVQTAVDWDKSPPEDQDSTDLEHTVTIGYRF